MKSTTIIILAGGRGTRLLDVTQDQVPKPMVTTEGLRGKPFLFWLVKWFYVQGFRDFIFSTGHLSHIIEQAPWSSWFIEAKFEWFREDKPLGTGGAVNFIFSKKPNLKNAWVINGDTLSPLNLAQERLVEGVAVYHLIQDNRVFDAIPNVLVKNRNQVLAVADSAEIGSLKRAPNEELFFDIGVVGISRESLDPTVTNGPLHRALSPAMAAGRVVAQIVNTDCFDIGTPARLARFVSFLSSSNVLMDI